MSALLTAPEVAARLRISLRTLKRRRQAGSFPGVFWDGGQWLWPAEAVDLYLAALRTTPITRARKATKNFVDARKRWRQDLVQRISAEFFPEYRKRRAS